MTTIEISLPDDLPTALVGSPAEFAAEMRLAAAVKWYELALISQGKAAELAGLSRAEFIRALGRYGVSAIQGTADDIVGEVAGG